MANFYFQSFGEYKTMLEHFNLTAEEVKGMHNGIVYSALDGKGNKVGNTMKSSSFGKYAGHDSLEKHFEDSGLLTFIFVLKVVHQYQYYHKSMCEFFGNKANPGRW